jgi:hypothetical protein
MGGPSKGFWRKYGDSCANPPLDRINWLWRQGHCHYGDRQLTELPVWVKSTHYRAVRFTSINGHQHELLCSPPRERVEVLLVSNDPFHQLHVIFLREGESLVFGAHPFIVIRDMFSWELACLTASQPWWTS